MYVNITGSANNKDVYIYQSYRKENGKTSSRIYRKLGKLNDLLARFDGDKDKMMAWAKAEAAKDTAACNQQKEKVSVAFSPTARIPLDEERSFHVGYLFLQKLCSELRIDNICRNIRNRHKFTYDLHAILTDLIYARILSPSSKMSSYSFCSTLLEPPKYSLQNLYRALSVWRKKRATYRKNSTVIPTSYMTGTRRSCTTIAPTTTSKSRRRAETGSMAKAKNTDPTRS